MPTILALQSNGFRATPDVDAAEPAADAAGRIASSRTASTWRAPSPAATAWCGRRSRKGRPIPRIADLRRRAADARHRRPGHQPGADGEGQPAEHAGVRDAPRQRRCRSRAPRCRSSRSTNQVAWTGTTNADGVAIAPALPLRGPKRWYETKFEFLVDGREGRRHRLPRVGLDRRHRALGVRHQLRRRRAAFAAARHGVRRPRRLPPRRGGPLQGHPPPRHGRPASRSRTPARTVYVSVRDSQDREIDQREVKLSAWGSVEWTQTLPAEGALGNYSVLMRLRPFTTADEEALDGAGAAAERRERGRERAERHRSRATRSAAASSWRPTAGPTSASTPR